MSNTVKAYQDKIIRFGEYPQTIKTDNVDITSTMDARGYYLGSDGAYYAKVIATPHEDDYTFSNGEYVRKGETYYFKVEPISWQTLSEESGVSLVLCDSIIANRRYATNSNNYAESEIRAWLNNEFYRTAFDSLQQSMIEVTEVDNSARSTNPDGNPTQWNNGENEYACQNTIEKIFLLSEREVTMVDYGFSSYDDYGATTARRRQACDYARATGIWLSTEPSDYYNGWWWLRSPTYRGCDLVRVVNDDGYVRTNSNVYHNDGGVVPAMRIRL